MDSLHLTLPLRIGIDARLWNETGVGRYIRNLITNLAQMQTKHEFVLFLKKQEFENLPLPGINFKKRLANFQWHSLQEQLFFPSVLYSENLDLVHFPYFSYPLFYFKPFIITIHDLILYHFPTGKASQLPEFLYNTKLFAYKILMQQASYRAQKIIAVSYATKQEIIDHLHVDEKEIVVTYESVDASVIHDKNISMNVSQPYFLYVGNAYPHKNLDMLLQAFAKFAGTTSHVNLILVGKEDYFYDALKRKLFDFHINQFVTVHTQVSDAELVFLYRHAIALVMPSLMEGFGLPVLEAMANNCLVIASDIPSLKEICDTAAMYFDPQNSEQLAEKLHEAYFQKNTQKMKEKGLQRVTRFSWEQMTKETLAIYESSARLRSY